MSGPIPEPQVRVPSSRPTWVALLAGPSLWFGHFMAVYLVSEVLCATETVDPAAGGLTVLAWTVVVTTLVVLLVIGFAAMQTQRYRVDNTRADDQILLLGIGLDAFFAAVVVVDALPVMFLTPC